MKMKTTPRNLFDELTEGMAALAEARVGKRTLRMHPIEGDTKDRTEELHPGS